MPELPEVETIVRNYRPRLEGRRIVGFRSRWRKQACPSAPQVRDSILGRTITRIGRRGKHIVFHLHDGGFLLVHLRMSGRFEWADANSAAPRHVRATWDLDDGSRLLFCDARKFGRLIYTRDLAAATAKLGHEPLERLFTAALLERELHSRSRQLKPLLLDQSVIVGLGNIYVDESLFRAGLHPQARSDELSKAQIQRLHRAIRNVLREGIRHQGTSFDWAYPGGGMQERLRVYGRTSEPCRRCGTPIAALRVAQRGTHICPTCQPPARKRRTRRRASQYIKQ
ncbi:MAG: DNA-formamidopyrimidine glycosylase [Planctomycetes bacterium]|nr:DNA-formamidopyrimidine glycosylase [Planctomycetota bacterium]